MFILTKISDLVQITPQDFRKPTAEAIEDNINAKYANKVIQRIGLCICLYDLLTASEGLIGHGNGIVNVNVTFRLVVFRPFKHEIMLGKISSSTTFGIKLRTDFFDDIHVPSTFLPEGSFFDHTEQLWIWNSEDGDQYHFDTNETVLFRVESEVWVDQTPVGPGRDEEADKKPPYTIEASMGDSGLGPVSWWAGAGEVAEEEEEA